MLGQVPIYALKKKRCSLYDVVNLKHQGTIITIYIYIYIYIAM